MAQKTYWEEYKDSLSGAVGKQITDPEEGTYTCKIRWAVGYYWLDEVQATQTLTYLIPTGEESVPMGWIWETKYNFDAQLQPTNVNFKGRRVREQDPGGGQDGCHRDGDDVEAFDHISGGTWPVRDGNMYGPDEVGYGYGQVNWYRTHVPSRFPCSTQFGQIMQINKGSGWQEYRRNVLKAGITATTVWVERDGLRREKNY